MTESEITVFIAGLFLGVAIVMVATARARR